MTLSINNISIMKTSTSSSSVSGLEIDDGGGAGDDEDGAAIRPAAEFNCTNQSHHDHDPTANQRNDMNDDSEDDDECEHNCPWLRRLSSSATNYTLLQSFHEQDEEEGRGAQQQQAPKQSSSSSSPPYALFFYYFFHGIQNDLPETALYFVLKDNFQVTPGDYSYISSLLWMPWALKPVFAYISDTFPICGKRRTPYMTIGLGASTVGWYFASWWSAPSPTPTITPFLFYSYLTALLIISIASVVAETAVDSLLAELAKKEQGPENFGWLQSTVWTMDSAGSVLGAMIPIIAFSNGVAPQTLLLWNAGLVSISALTVCFIKEEPYEYQPPPPPAVIHQHHHLRVDADVNNSQLNKDTVSSLDSTATPLQQDPLPAPGPIQDIYQRLCQNPVLVKALVFVFLVSSSPTSGDAFTYYQTDILNFSPAFLSWTTVIQTVANFLAAWAYAAFLRTWNLRHVFSTAIVGCMLIGLSNIVVVQRWNVAWGVSDKCFIVGDTLAQGVAGEIVFMPVAVLAAHLAPVGREGTFYALTMSVLNIAWALSQFLSGVFANLFQVASPDHYEHLTALMVTVGALTLVPLLFLNLVPKISDMQCSNTPPHDEEEATESPSVAGTEETEDHHDDEQQLPEA